MAAYAYVCQACSHLSSNHLLAEDGDLRGGPYRCAHCPCEVPQDHPTSELNEREFRAYMERPDTPPNVWSKGDYIGSSTPEAPR